MDKLTALERALLKEFEGLANEFVTLAEAQETLARGHTAQFNRYSAELTELKERQIRLETLLNDVSEALDRQTASTNDLIDTMTRLRG